MIIQEVHIHTEYLYSFYSKSIFPEGYSLVVRESLKRQPWRMSDPPNLAYRKISVFIRSWRLKCVNKRPLFYLTALFRSTETRKYTLSPGEMCISFRTPLGKTTN